MSQLCKQPREIIPVTNIDCLIDLLIDRSIDRPIGRSVGRARSYGV